MSQTAAHLVDHVIPHVPVRQWVLSLPIPLRLLLAAQPELVTPVLHVVQRVVTRGPRAGQKVLTLRGATPRETAVRQPLCADIDGNSAARGSARG